MDIKQILKQLLKDNEEIYSLVGTVSKLDESRRVCSVKPNDGSAELFNVRLQTQVAGTEGLVIIPEEDSEVIVTFLSKELGFISSTSKIQKIMLNSDGFSAEMSLIKSKFEALTLIELLAPQIILGGGIALTGPLSDQINGIKEDINGLKEIFGAWAPSSETALKTALGAYIASPLELMEDPPAESEEI